MWKSIRIIAITVCLISIATTLFADWHQQYPGIAGGPLSGRNLSGMTSIGNGRILLLGGTNSSGTYYGDTWIYDIDLNRWTKLSPSVIGGPMNNRYGHGMAYLGAGSALAYGGRYDSLGDGKTWVYHYESNSWTNMNPSQIGGTLNSIALYGMCYIDEGKVLMFGGQYWWNGYTNYNNTWLYDLSQNQWQLMSPTIVGEGFQIRYDLGLAYIGNGRALMFGGANGSSVYSDTWVYDLGQNQWTKMTPSVMSPIGTLLTARRGVGLAYIGGDRVLLFGGTLSSGERSNQIWMYDLSDNQWTYITNSASIGLPVARERMAFTFTGLGQVVMFGGLASTVLNDTWRFSIPDNIQSSIDWQIVPAGLELSWSMPEDLAVTHFSIYRDGVQLSPSVSPGTPANGIIPFTFLDPSPAPNKIYRYQIKETYPVMNSELFYPEIGVPYCQ
jgi:hypothetical protein